MAMKQKDNWICLLINIKQVCQSLCHSSEISITTALTNRKQESSLANILATFVGRHIVFVLSITQFVSATPLKLLNRMLTSCFRNIFGEIFKFKGA
jgi:hypothetical protein